MVTNKKYLTLLSLLTVTSTCFAYVDLPSLRPGFVVDGSALWFQPSATNLNYVIYNKFQPTPSPRWLERELNPNYDPGFEIGIRYIIPECAENDVYLNWTRFNSTTSGATIAPNSNYFLGPDYIIGPPGGTIRRADGQVQFRLDVINLEFGQYFDFRRLKMRFFAGLSNPYLREEIKTTFSGAGIFGRFTMLQDVNVKFTGVGPRIGMEGTYPVGYGFGFMGEGAVAAMIGSLSTATNFTGNSQTGSHNNHQFLKDQTTTQVIPGFDAKLGMNYKYEFANCMSLTATLGYQAAVYINAISQYLPGSLLNLPGVPSDFSSGGLFVATVNHTLSNYSVQGPFFNLAVAF